MVVEMKVKNCTITLRVYLKLMDVMYFVLEVIQEKFV